MQFKNNNKTYKLLKECSIYSAEVFAIIKVIQIIIDKEHTNFIILSASLRATNSINAINKKKQIQVQINITHTWALWYARKLNCEQT